MSKKYNRQTLGREERDLKDRQAMLRRKKDALQDRKEDLRADLYKAIKAGDSTTEKVIRAELDEIKEDIREINTELKVNSDGLESCSKIVKNKDEGMSSKLGALFMGLGTGAGIWLGKKSLEKAYGADESGQLVNKRTLEVFNRLNPIKMIMSHVRR